MKRTIAFELSILLVHAYLASSAAAQTKPAADWKALVEAAKREGVAEIFDLKNRGGLKSLWDYLVLPELRVAS